MDPGNLDIQTNPTTGWCANIFTAKSNEVLKAISFYTTDLNCNYVINIYNNTGSKPINQAAPSLTQSGTISNAGYNTVPLNSGVQLNAGQKFSVVLEHTNPIYQLSDCCGNTYFWIIVVKQKRMHQKVL